MTIRIAYVGSLMCILLCFLLTSLIPVCYTSSTEEASSRYECGAHGRFEYCIDGIPDCVIGCHCHPGYYFDTDTKICEPNTKLAQDFQRRYMAEPTRVHPVITPTVTESVPTPTTTSALDETVDEIAKDTDDLGDWLFNQFFKTIETQVINNTNDEQTMTRRSGLDVYRPMNLPKRVSHGEDAHIDKIKPKARKSWRSRGKKKKSKTHGLRRKLLRITEDDSLFDSDSDEDSSGGGSDSSSSGSSSGSSSSERSKEDKKEKVNKNDREHGHKKVIIFNKRPRPPLPSFIFLPSMDTPYYPPIGLPPPPVLPMYPMVPVPPMAPFIPFIDHNNGSSTTTAASKAPESSDGETTTAETTTAASDASEAPANPDPADEEAVKHSDRRTRQKGHRARIQMPTKMSSEETFMIRARDTPSRTPFTSKHAEQMKLINKLRQRLKKKNKLSPIQDNDIIDQDEDSPFLDGSSFSPNSPTLHSSRKQTRHRPRVEKDQALSDVNFKYITELIHRANLSEADPPQSPAENKTDLKQLKKHQHSRRNYEPEESNMLHEDEPAVYHNANIQNPEDAYFTNLGRQIAYLVRNVESKIDNNLASEQSNQQKPIPSGLHDDSYVPRSYWERTVRSPLTRFKNYIDRLNLDKESDEKDLFSLEDEVKTLATTLPPLSLQDLENILSTLQKAQAGIDKSKKSTDQSNGSFNVNLLPNKPDNIQKSDRKFNPMEYAEYYPRTKYLTSKTNISRDPTNSNATHYLNPSNLDLPMIDDWMFDSQDYNYKQAMNLDQPITNQQSPVNKSLEHENSKFNGMSPLPFYKKINAPSEYLKYLQTKPSSTLKSTKKSDSPSKYHESPVNFPELHVKLSEQPKKLSEWSAKYAEVSAKYPEMSAKYRELLTKSSDQLSKLTELSAKHPAPAQKYSEIPAKNVIQSDKYQAKPTVTYKSLDYFSDAENKRHYTFEASYPLQIPSYRRSFSKRFEPDSGKQSYFHHELHHFDYID